MCKNRTDVAISAEKMDMGHLAWKSHMWVGRLMKLSVITYTYGIKSN